MARRSSPRGFRAVTLTTSLVIACTGSSAPGRLSGPLQYCLTIPANLPQDTQCNGTVVTDVQDSGLPARFAQLAMVCTEEDGLVVPSCPTANLVGCCQGYDGETCYYSRTVDYWRQDCCAGNQCPEPYQWSATSF